MSATVMNPPVTENQTAKLAEEQTDIQSVKCECCGLTEECTAAYISRIRERYKGKWICGLCAEAVKDEVVRSPKLITTDEAINKQIKFRNGYRTGSEGKAVVDLITAMRQILRRSVGSTKSMPSSPTRGGGDGDVAVLMRSGSCIPSLSLAEDSDSYSCPSIEEEDGDVAVDEKEL